VSRIRAFLTRATITVATSCLATVLFAFPAVAQSNNSNYIFLLASGFLCDPGDSSTCPAMAKANQGDSYELSGAGMFDAQNKSVKAAGTYTHKSPNGNVLEMGVWLANELASFDSYGAAPGALPHKGLAFGTAPFGPRRLPMSPGPMPTGGLAVFRISLLPMSGPSRTAVLQVNCALGKVPDEHPVEGIRLAFEGGGAPFDEEVSGRTLFVLTRPGASVAPKKRQPPGVDQDLLPLEPKP
jgi:hypothetical protein